jgi:hypothetical protein
MNLFVYLVANHIVALTFAATGSPHTPGISCAMNGWPSWTWAAISQLPAVGTTLLSTTAKSTTTRFYATVNSLSFASRPPVIQVSVEIDATKMSQNVQIKKMFRINGEN